jgi:hypothetical protein
MPHAGGELEEAGDAMLKVALLLSLDGGEVLRRILEEACNELYLFFSCTIFVFVSAF